MEYKKHPLFIASSFFIAYAFLSVLWSVSPLITLWGVFQLFSISFFTLSWFAFCSSRHDFSRDKILSFLTAGVFVALFLLLLDIYVLKCWISDHLRGVYYVKAYVPPSLALSLAVWLGGAFLWEKKYYKSTLLLFILCAFTFYSVDCDTIAVSFAMGIILGALSLYLKPQFLKKALQLLTIGMFLLFPLGVSCVLSPSFLLSISKEKPIWIFSYTHLHRLHIWKYVSQEMLNKPLLGHGFDTSRAYKLAGEKREISWFEKGKKHSLHSDALPLHPHNVSLQIGLELGLIGMLLFAGILYFVPLLIPSQSFFFIGWLVSIGVTMFVNIGAWQTWWLAVIFLTGGFWFLMCRTSEEFSQLLFTLSQKKYD